MCIRDRNNVTASGIVNSTTLNLLEGSNGVGYNYGITLDQVRYFGKYLRYDIKTVSSYVMELQILLNEQGYSCGRPDGKFGSNTKSAVRAFQTAFNLTSDGIVGASTMEMCIRDRYIGRGTDTGGCCQSVMTLYTS